MLKALVDFWKWSAPWRNEFGAIAGLRIALALRRAMWAAPANSLISIEVPTLRHPVTLRAGTSDASVFTQVFVDHQADFPVLKDPAVIVDAGANIGLTAAVFAERFPRARILALEIDPGNFSLLRQNTGRYENVEPLFKGLWAGRSRIRIENPDAPSWGLRAAEVKAPDASSIEALGVADILADFHFPRIDLLKIDIEGGEFEVFTGAVDEWIARVEMIAVEVHDRLRPGCTEAIRRAVIPHGFRESTWAEYLIYTRDTEANPPTDPAIAS